ncbi:MAG: cyclase family protein, partial [Bdellovibrionales bacterium]|nr:cyclase family protein [Bdellovibrionales bacterium]
MEFKYYDISPLISSRIGVFPGDQKYERKINMSYEMGQNLEVSAISSTLHLGAHADAPNHYHKNGEAIHQRSLSYYYGNTQVLHVSIPRGQAIEVLHISNIEILAPRVLFCTQSFPDPDNWNSNFCYLSPDLVEYLAEKQVRLVGIDTPSIDPEDSKELKAHHSVFNNNMA